MCQREKQATERDEDKNLRKSDACKVECEVETMRVVPAWPDERYLNTRSSKLTGEQMVKHIDMMEPKS